MATKPRLCKPNRYSDVDVTTTLSGSRTRKFAFRTALSSKRRTAPKSFPANPRESTSAAACSPRFLVFVAGFSDRRSINSSKTSVGATETSCELLALSQSATKYAPGFVRSWVTSCRTMSGTITGKLGSRRRSSASYAWHLLKASAIALSVMRSRTPDDASGRVRRAAPRGADRARERPAAAPRLHRRRWSFQSDLHDPVLGSTA